MTILYLGRTPLHYSAENGHVDVVKYLVDHGADMNIQAVSYTHLTLPTKA